MKALILVLSIASATAQAGEYKQYFMSNGKKVDATEAIIEAAKGADVVKCQSVEFKVSKSGTSIGLKNTKKPKQ